MQLYAKIRWQFKCFGIIFALSFFFVPQKCYSVHNQSDSARQKKYYRAAIGASGAVYAGSFFALDRLWYQNGKSKFHFFNDNSNWLQTDKIGHAFTSYHLSRYSFFLYQKAGMPSKKAAWYASITGAMAMMPIEFLDGFSPDYGASWGDALANCLGASFFGAQEIIWKKQLIKLKYSYHESSIATIRPSIFGKNLAERLLKDYNGQSLWLSISSDIFWKKKHFGQYFQLSLGYSGREMLYAEEEKSRQAGFYPNRNLYLSIDIAWEKISSKNRFLSACFRLLSLVKFPMPMLAYSKGNFYFYPIYF